jgi:hypothetical protein
MTKEEFQKHLKDNIQDPYSASVVVAALYKKIFGEYPKIGLSGFQAEGAEWTIARIDELKVQ